MCKVINNVIYRCYFIAAVLRKKFLLCRQIKILIGHNLILYWKSKNDKDKYKEKAKICFFLLSYPNSFCVNVKSVSWYSFTIVWLKNEILMIRIYKPNKSICIIRKF